MTINVKSMIVVAILVVVAIGALVVASPTTRAAGPWYVAPGGSDGNNCLSPATSCASISGTLNKPGFVAGDAIRIAVGTYSGTGSEVVLLDENATLSGGWDTAFTMQSGMSTIDAQGTRRGITVNSGVTAIIERFIVKSGYVESGNGGGIYNAGTLILDTSAVSSNMITGYTSNGQGGGVHNSGGTLILTNSSVSNNTAQGLGGGIYNTNFGALTLTNSTVSGNIGFVGGGIYNDNAGTISLNNSTISGNTNSNGGPSGINNYYPNAVKLRNTILAGNTYGDCSDQLQSTGHNLIGTIAGCTYFAPSASDLINVDPRLFILVGSPGYHPLLPGSLAIDAGNPSGCTDHLGHPLTTDQRGATRPMDGNGDSNAICDIGAYELDPNDPIMQVFLPVTTRDFCPDFIDDFSNPASGWPVGEDDLVRSEYLGGEYRVLSKNGDYIYLFRSPSCDRANYVVEADARWVGTPGLSYGIVFGITSDFSRYYLFDVSADFQDFLLARRDPGGFTLIVPPTASPAISGGTASNHLRVKRDGSQITLEVNGTVLGAWFDGGISGSTGAGIYSNPYTDPPISDARFDNFSMASVPGSGLAVRAAINITAESGDSDVVQIRTDVRLRRGDTKLEDR